MADVTISSLPLGTPSGNLVVPISDGNNTYRAPLSDIQVNYNSLTNRPTIGIGGKQLFTSSGAFTVPAGVTKIEIHAIGGGGGGGTALNYAGNGGDTFITGIDLVAGGGTQGGGGITGTGGVCTGSLIIVSSSGNNGSEGNFPPGGPGLRMQGIRIFGAGGNGGSNSQGASNSGRGGGSGGYAMGVATVTPGQALIVNVGGGGAAASGPGTGGSGSGGSGGLLIEW